MKTTTRNALLGGSSIAPAITHSRPGFASMLRGPSIAYAAENEGGAEGQGDQGQGEGDKGKQPETIDPAKYQGLQSAHDRLKRDAAADRAALKELNEWKAGIEAKQAEADEARAREAGDFDTVKKQLEDRYGKEVTKREETIGKQRSQIEKLVIDAGLAQAISAVGVAPEFVGAVSALLRQGVEIRDDDDGNPVALRGGAPLAEAVRLWAENDGKAFIRNGNSGGGAQGGQGANPGGKKITRAEFEKLSPTEKARVSRELEIVDG